VRGGKPLGNTLRVKEMEKSVGEQIYLKEGKRIPKKPQESPERRLGHQESPLVVGGVLEKKRVRKWTKRYGRPLYRSRTQYIKYIHPGVRYI
jgi:hypothetical protein